MRDDSLFLICGESMGRVQYCGQTCDMWGMIMKLYLLRHGETIWNQEHRLQGHRDIPLSEEGIRQVEETACRLKESGERFDRILASPLSRARDSARIVAGAVGYPFDRILIEPDLIERCFGVAEGTTPQERGETRFGQMYPGMETMDALCGRALGVVERCLMQEELHTVLLVSHGMLLKALMMAVLKGNTAEDAAFPIVPPASLSLLTERDGAWELKLDLLKGGRRGGGQS